MLCSALQSCVPITLYDKGNQLAFLFFTNKLLAIQQATNHIIYKHIYLTIINMAQYKETLKHLFKSWNKTFELSSKILDAQLRRNALKKLQGNYRRFQKQVEMSYSPSQQIDIGLIRYYQVLAEKQHKAILQLNYPISKSISFKRINPWPLRQSNFQHNRIFRQKIDMSSFIN